MSDIGTTCPYCGVGCGLRVRGDGTIAGDPEHPANFGLLCSKGAALAETLIDTERLTDPTIDGRRATWDEALDLVAFNFGRAIDLHGPNSVALYVSGQFLTEDYYVANKLMKGFIGSANIDTNSRLCMASSVAGHIRAFGEDIVPGCYEDIDEADLIILVGSNAAWCHPVLYRRIIAAREKRGTKIVVIDPRRTETAEVADLILQLRGGSDVALFSGLLLYLEATGAIDADFITQHTDGYVDALQAAHSSSGSLDVIATATGLSEHELRSFYELFAKTPRVVMLYSQGVNQSRFGTDKVNAIINCHLAAGRIGKPGCGPFSLTGQPNAMGGREVGGLANQLAAHMSFFDPADVDRVRRFWKAPRMAAQPGLKAVDLFDAALDGRIKALWILGTNPAASMPRAARVREALAACPFVVVSDCWPTDTTEHARVVLPAAGWGEKDGTVTNSERRISRQRRFRLPHANAKPDWWMLAEVGQRLGWRKAFSYANSAAIFREHAALSAFENDGARVFDIGALADISDDAYEKLRPVQWPCRRGEAPGSARLFEDGRFATTNGRAQFVALSDTNEAVDYADKLRLNTGRVRDQWHTMTRTGRVARLMTHTSEPFIDVHPVDAVRLDLRDGQLARVESDHSAMPMRVRISNAQRRGEVFAPMHWTDRHAASGPVDQLVTATVDPISGQPDLKATDVVVTPLPAFWHGLLLSTADCSPRLSADVYWTKAPCDRGVSLVLTGLATLNVAAFAELPMKEMLGVAPESDLILYADPGQKVFRFAAFAHGRLAACLFLATEKSLLPSSEEFAPLLGRDEDQLMRISLLMGVTLSGHAPVQGKTVCVCHGVSEATIRKTVAGEGLKTVDQIGARLNAGTSCGSCVPELRRLLREGESKAPADLQAMRS